MARRRRQIGWLALAWWLAAGAAWAQALPGERTTIRPFRGVTYSVRRESRPRPLAMHVVEIDLKAPGLRFRLTPPAGPRETRKQTVLAFLTEQKAQIAVNAHFFEPWPVPKGDDGSADLVGIAASDGKVFSPFEANPPKSYAIRANAPGLNIDANNHASIVHRNGANASGRTVVEPVTLYNTLAGNEQIVTGGRATVADSDWNKKLSPRTAIGIAKGERLVIFVVDGRQSGRSEGMTSREVADLLVRDYGVTDALNLDGGGSTTLAMADPNARVANVPVGLGDAAGTLRPVGSSLAIFAAPAAQSRPAEASGVKAGRFRRDLAPFAAVAGAAILAVMFWKRRGGGIVFRAVDTARS
ncbi:MAG: phosphodiester glycosidase family protein [Planctomycetota bacterium]|nr:phosphodiester glycosidase family protein [Planctomycetota bacterium]